jgi:hypothetical protein
MRISGIFSSMKSSSTGTNVIDRVSLSAFERSERLKKFARFEEKNEIIPFALKI